MAGGMIRGTAALALCLVVAACGGGSSGGGSSSAPATATSGVASPTGSAAPTGSSGAQESVDGIPFYQPSTTVSEAAGTVVLRSTDSVAKVSAFYDSVISRDGWTVVSRSTTSSSAHLTIKKSGRGATIVVVSRPGNPTVISISTYPSP